MLWGQVIRNDFTHSNSRKHVDLICLMSFKTQVENMEKTRVVGGSKNGRPRAE